LISEQQAKRVIAQWAALPNGIEKWRQTDVDDERMYVETEPDGRTKDDLEIVRIVVTEVCA
jgi:hypothetical protein